MRFSVFVMVLWALLAGCQPSAPTAPPPKPPPFGQHVAEALAAEASQPLDPTPYFELIDLAIARPESPDAVMALLAGLDGLVYRTDDGPYSAVAYRSRDGFSNTVIKLRQLYQDLDATRSPYAPAMKALLAETLFELASYTGEEDGAAFWAQKSGCIQEALVIGPTDWRALSALEQPSPVGPTSPLMDRYPGVAPFDAGIEPQGVVADRCVLPVVVRSVNLGLRTIVVDLDNPEDQRLTFGMMTESAAKLEVGGITVLERGFDEGRGGVGRIGSVFAPAGVVRVALRVAYRGDGGSVSLGVVGEDGQPIPHRAPRPGESADSLAEKPQSVLLHGSPDASPSQRLLVAAGHLALGSVRQAFDLLEPSEGAQDRHPSADWLLLRTLYEARVSDSTRLSMQQGAVKRITEAWPGTWVARTEEANLVEMRRGYPEGTTEALSILQRDTTLDSADIMTLQATLRVADQLDLHDITHAAFAELGERVPGSALLSIADDLLFQRTGPEQVAAACEGGLPRAEPDCLLALADVGDHEAMWEELERLRRLRRSSTAFLAFEAHQRVRLGEVDAALEAYDKLYPAQRTLLSAVALAAAAGDAEGAESRLWRDVVQSPSGLSALPTMVRALDLAPSYAEQYEGKGRALIEQDRKSAFLPGAGTAVLAHEEQYRLEASGLLHYVLYDVRRVSGTTDVDSGAMRGLPMFEARSMGQVLRRRIYKRDGRVIEPDGPFQAMQANADLSQLEPGDYIEEVHEGWALPNAMGQLLLDTQDVLPPRTSIQSASIRVTLPADLPMKLWAHPMFDKSEKTESGERTLVFSLGETPARRIEDGVHYLEQGVRLSMGTQTWDNVGAAIGESIRSLDDRDPYVAAFAREALEGAAPESLSVEQRVERVVGAVGSAIKVTEGAGLSDFSAMYSGGSQGRSAREMLEGGSGSRVWVIYRLLREVGVDAEIAVAETEPFASAPGFPPHPGRFVKPLVLVRRGGDHLWIDADVNGPPLPPGRLSPELRGRSAIVASGEILAVEGTAESAPEKMHVELKLDDDGNARGTIELTLHGKTAQLLADAFDKVVGGDRRELLRKVVQVWFPRADVERAAVKSQNGAWEIVITADVFVSGFARDDHGEMRIIAGFEPLHLTFPYPSVGTLASRYVSLGGRATDLSIDDSSLYEVTRRVELPSSMKIVRPPPSVDVTSPWLSAKRTFRQDGSAIVESFSLNMPTGVVPLDAFQAFATDVRTVDDGFLAGIRLEAAP